jgi:hypothetical protein
VPAPLKAPPRTSAETRSLYEEEIVKSKVDKDKLRFLSDLLQSQERNEERAEKSAASLLPTVTAERDTLLAKVAELEPVAARVVELETFKADADSWKAEQTKLLVATAERLAWDAQRFRNEAEEKVREADNKVSASGWTQLRQTLADLIARHGVPQPDFWETPATMPSAFWELWGWSPAKSKVYTALKTGYKEPGTAFRAQLLAHLKRTLPLQQFAGMEPPAPISDLSEKIACMTEMAQRWNVWLDIEREFEQAQVERQAAFLRNHNAAMSAAEHDAAWRGMGRTPLGQQEPASITGCPPGEPHLAGCVCRACGGNGNVEGNWSGFIPASPGLEPQPTNREDEDER